MRTPRWRCADPHCPKHRWQTVTAVGEYDELDVALGALEAHWATDHPEQETESKAA